MTVAEWIQELKNLPQDYEIFMTNDFYDTIMSMEDEGMIINAEEKTIIFG